MSLTAVEQKMKSRRGRTRNDIIPTWDAWITSDSLSSFTFAPTPASYKVYRKSCRCWLQGIHYVYIIVVVSSLLLVPLKWLKIQWIVPLWVCFTLVLHTYRVNLRTLSVSYSHLLPRSVGSLLFLSLSSSHLSILIYSSRKVSPFPSGIFFPYHLLHSFHSIRRLLFITISFLPFFEWVSFFS